MKAGTIIGREQEMAALQRSIVKSEVTMDDLFTE